MKETFKIFIFLIFTLKISSQYLPAYFDVQLDRISVNFTDPKFLSSNLKIRKVKKVRSIVGEIIWHIPLDDNLTSEAKFLKKQGNEYRYMPYTYNAPLGLCSAILKDGNKNKHIKTFIFRCN